jgi:hypothetical protein
MKKRQLVSVMEWVRPFGVSAAIFFSYYHGSSPVSRFHILGLFIVMIMSGTTAFESLVLGEAASRKIGYPHNRAYQIQSGLANAAMACVACFIYLSNWGKYADATIVLVMLTFFTFSAVNHVVTAFVLGNLRPVNLMRPALTFLLLIIVLPALIRALR